MWQHVRTSNKIWRGWRESLNSRNPPPSRVPHDTGALARARAVPKSTVCR